MFYEDEITAVRLEDGRAFTSMRAVCDRLGVDWPAQRRRINHDAVLSEESQGVAVTDTPGGRQEILCLPLNYIWLFGTNAARVNPDVRERIIHYQRECYKVLAEVFQDGRLTTDPELDIEILLQQDSRAAQAKMAMAVVRMARQQLLIEARLETAVSTLAEHGEQISEYGERLDQLESAC